MDLLTPYDEFPCHQAPQPFSHIPSTDLNWDEGYYFAIMNPDEQVMFCTGFRINPNTDISPIMMLLSVASSARKSSSTSMKLVPLTGSPPMPTAVVWPRPALEVWNTAS